MSDFVPAPERQKQIHSLLMQQGRLSVAEIVKHFEISEATARRDLESLASQGKVQRVHGGVISIEQAPPESPILERENEQADEKKRIGLSAANLVADKETVFLGSGTTVLEVARNLHTKKNLTVITNSLLVISALADRPDVTVIGLGGILRRTEMYMFDVVYAKHHQKVNTLILLSLYCVLLINCVADFTVINQCRLICI